MKILLILLFLISCSKEGSHEKVIQTASEVKSILDLKVVDGSILELDTDESISLSGLLNKTISYNIIIKNNTVSTKSLPSNLTVQLQGPSSEITPIEQKHNCPTSLSRYRSCTISLSLMSSSPIVGSGYVLVDGLQIPVTFDIKDEEVIATSVSVTPELINFGEVKKNTTVKQTVDIKNITVNKISLPIEVNNGNGVTVSAGTCGSLTTINLDRFRSCKVEVSLEVGDLTESTTFNITDFLKIQDINVALTANYTSLEKVSPIVLVNASSFVDNIIDVSSPKRLEFWNNSPNSAEMFYDVSLLTGKVDFKSTCPASLSRYRKCYIYLSNPKEEFTLEASFVGKTYIVKNSTAVTRLCEVSDITTTPEVGDLNLWMAGSYTISGTVVNGVPDCSLNLCEGKTPNYTLRMCEQSIVCSLIDAQTNGWETSNFETIAGDKIVRQDSSSDVSACHVSSCLSGFNLNNDLKKCSMTEIRNCDVSDITTTPEVGDLNLWMAGSYTISGTVTDGVPNCSLDLCSGQTPNYDLKMCEQSFSCSEADVQANDWDMLHAVTFSGNKIVRQDGTSDKTACKVDSCATNYSVDVGSKKCLANTRACEISDITTTPEVGDLNLWMAGSYTIDGEVVGDDPNCSLNLCAGQNPNYDLKMCEQSFSCNASDAQENGWDVSNANSISGSKTVRQDGSIDVSFCSVSVCSSGFTLNNDLKTCDLMTPINNEIFSEINLGSFKGASLFTKVNEYVFFRSSNQNSQVKLFKMKIGSTTPIQIADTYVGGSDNPISLTPFNGYLYYNARNANNKEKLYRVNENSTIPEQIQQVGSDTTSDQPSLLTVGGNFLFYRATNANGISKFYRVSNSNINITQVSDTNPSGSDAMNNGSMIYSGGNIYFGAINSAGYSKLFRLSPNSTTPIQVSNINGNSNNDAPLAFVSLGNYLYFSAYRSINTATQALYKISHDATGLYDVSKVLDDTTYNQVLTNAYEVNGYLYFSRINSSGYKKLYRMSPSGTMFEQIQETNAVGNDSPSKIVRINDYLYYSALNSNNQTKLFRVPISSTVNEQLQEINVGVNDSIKNLTGFNNILYFNATNVNGYTKLYKFSPDSMTNQQIADFYPTGSDNPSSLTVVDDYLYFGSTTSSGQTGMFIMSY